MAELASALVAALVTWAAMSTRRQADITKEIFTRLNRLETSVARLEEASRIKESQ